MQWNVSKRIDAACGQNQLWHFYLLQQSLCNSEAVHDLLRDPDLMDSVSIRELRIADSEVKTHLNTIKELTVPVGPEPQIVGFQSLTLKLRYVSLVAILVK